MQEALRGLLASLANLTGELWSHGDPVSRRKMDKIPEDDAQAILWLPHAYTHIQTCTHTCMKNEEVKA